MTECVEQIFPRINFIKWNHDHNTIKELNKNKTFEKRY